LKNATKYRSYSESLSEPSTSLPNDYRREESVFERCSTTDDLSSSNENNSLMNSLDSNSLTSMPSSVGHVKHVTFNNQISRKTFKPGGPVSGMRKLSSNQQRKLKKRRRQDSLNSQSSDQDEHTTEKRNEKTNETAQVPEDDRNPVQLEDVITEKATGELHISSNNATKNTVDGQSAVRLTNGLIFELDD
jgi:hypothetical protein